MNIASTQINFNKPLSNRPSQHKFEDNTADWEAARSPKFEPRDEADLYNKHSHSPLLFKEEDDPVLQFFDYFCMLIGILAKTQVFFLGAVLFYLEVDNTCVVSKDNTDEPIPRNQLPSDLTGISDSYDNVSFQY
jgi:hypothetical protein